MTGYWPRDGIWKLACRAVIALDSGKDRRRGLTGGLRQQKKKKKKKKKKQQKSAEEDRVSH